MLLWVALACSTLLVADELKLDDAVRLALEHNREIANAALDVAISDSKRAELRTRQWPSLSFYALGAQQLQKVSFTIERGQLGSYTGIGPVPDRDTQFSTPLKPTGILIGRASQPLTALKRIHLGMKMADISRAISQQQARLKRQDVVRNVKQLYYGMQQTESSLKSVRETLRLYQEVQRLTTEYVAQQTALEGDRLSAETRVAQTEESELALANQLATQKEQLNLLLGRDVLTEFTVTEGGEPTFEADLAAARQKALEQRPETKAATLKIEYAEQDLKSKRTEYIPDVSVDFNTVRLLAFDSFLPTQFTSAGVSLSWEPWDWGRKKHEMNEKRYAITQAQNSEMDARSKVLIDVNDKYRQVMQLRSQLRVARLSQQTAMENLRVARRKLELQASLVRDTLQAQANLEQANSDYQQALAKYATARADFEHAIGEDQ